ncbi:MAG TPA: hypothetical protein PK720_00405 [bacterium]|nr:hypothetical protein [bacterium]
MKKQGKAQLWAIVFPLWKNRNKADELMTDGENRMIISFYINNIEYNGIFINNEILKRIKQIRRKNKEKCIGLKILSFP